ncbi:hypothetical protein GCM10020367_05330 [Streptomyces sannanensis]|uniref:Insertion element IS402-like domain-containing protein n=1 Tax=Streptomyces sannanensis TaxID=285536 RepID=A0ABP6S502_9ACTN
MTRRQLTDEQWKFIEPYLPIGSFGPYPERLRQQFEGMIWRFRSGAQWRELPAEFGPGRPSAAVSESGGTPASSPPRWKA